MSNDSNAPDIIQKALTHAIKDLELMGVGNDYGKQALQSFEDYIELERHHFTEDQRLYRRAITGAYLGESICRRYGGKWYGNNDSGWHVRLDGYTAEINVFGKVEKWLESGATGDSIVSLYRAIPALMTHFDKTDDET